MTTELEQEFFKTFGIKPKFRYYIQSELPIIGTDRCRPCYDLTKEQFKNFALSRAKGYKIAEIVKFYPEITDRKLLQLLCIYNDMQGCVELCITPCKYEDVKENILSTLINEKFAMIDCEKETYMDVMTQQIQQLFKER